MACEATLGHAETQIRKVLIAGDEGELNLGVGLEKVDDAAAKGADPDNLNPCLRKFRYFCVKHV